MYPYSIKYHISNVYEEVVSKAVYQILITPTEDKHQKVTKVVSSNSLGIEPTKIENCFGFELWQYDIQKPFASFEVDLHCEVEVDEINPFDFSALPIEQEYEQLFNSDFQIDNFMFNRTTPLTTIKKTDRADFPLYDKSTQLFDYLILLNTTVYNYLSYIAGSTTIETTINDILASKKGVCQDYAHLFTALCRSQKIPCRYCSGYLDQGGDLAGNHQLHAWVEVLIPSVGWKGFDPTNNLVVNHHYIKIAHGCDYNDCSPLKGILQGNTTGKASSEHQVEVSNQ